MALKLTVNISFKRIRYSIALLCGAFLLSCSLPAQTSDSANVRKNIEALTRIWDDHRQFVPEALVYDSLSSLGKLFTVPAGIKDSLNAKMALISYEQAQLRADKGLSFEGNYLENFAGTQGDEDILYLRRAQAGVQWDLLSGGLFGNRNHIERLANEAQIASLQMSVQSSAKSELFSYNTIIYVFNLEKTDLLAERKKLCESKLEILNKLYAQQAINYLTYLDATKQQADINAMYALYTSYNDEMHSLVPDSVLPAHDLPLFDIDADRMFSFAGLTTIPDSINALTLQNLSLENSPVNNIKLDLFVRYNYYEYPAAANNPTRGFVSAGAGVSVPFSSFSQYNHKVVDAEQRVMQLDVAEQTNSRTLTLANLLYEFRYKLKQYEGFASKRREYFELLRIENVKEQFHDLEFNPVTSLTLLDELLEIEIEMTDLRQQLYLKLLEISHELPGVPVSSYIKTWNPMVVSQNIHSLNRSIYIWSNTVKNNSASAINSFITSKGVSSVIVSPGKDKDSYARTKTLIDTLLLAKTEVQLLIGENSLMKRKDPASYFDSVYSALGSPKIAALHLDVEPHTFSDWDQNKDAYLKTYVSLVQAAKTWCTSKGLQLNVSIPVFYPATTLSSIYAFADHVYVMAYETNDAQKIMDRTREERAIDPDRTVIALRAKDFDNERLMNDFLFLLGEKIQQRNFAIHDYESWSIIKP